MGSYAVLSRDYSLVKTVPLRVIQPKRPQLMPIIINNCSQTNPRFFFISGLLFNRGLVLKESNYLLGISYGGVSSGSTFLFSRINFPHPCPQTKSLERKTSQRLNEMGFSFK